KEIVPMPSRVERIDPQQTVLLVVDMENDFVAPGSLWRRLPGEPCCPLSSVPFPSVASVGSWYKLGVFLYARLAGPHGRRKRVGYGPVPCPSCQSTEVIKAGKHANGPNALGVTMGGASGGSFCCRTRIGAAHL